MRNVKFCAERWFFKRNCNFFKRGKYFLIKYTNMKTGFLLVRKRSEPIAKTEKSARVSLFAAVAFVQRGVAECRRVSRYRGEADV